MNGAVFGLWHPGDSAALAAMGAMLTHCGEAQRHYELGNASLYVGVRSPRAQLVCPQVPAVCVGAIGNASHLLRQHVLPMASHPCPNEELIWRLYCGAGVPGLMDIQGAYQLALYDASRRKLILAAGPQARLPLCVARLPHGWTFAPELKALQRVPSVHEELGRAALAAQMEGGDGSSSHPTDATVRYVWPGQVGTFDEAEYRIDPMRACEAPPCADASADTLADLRRSIISTLRRIAESSRSAGIAITPGVGSLVCLGAARWVLREQPLRTFAVVYGERDPFGAFAQRVARHFETDHEEIVLTPDTVRSLLGELAWETEHPFASERMLDHLLVARIAAGEVDLLLNGDICFVSERRTPVASDDLTPSLANLRDVASFDRVHARAGVPCAALFHEAAVRAGCVRAASAMRRVYSGSTREACALGAGFVPARLLEEACHARGRANERFWREMRVTCEDLLANDSLSMRGMRRLGGELRTAFSASASGEAAASACRCLPAPLWSRVMLEVWCRIFIDGPAHSEREPVTPRVRASETASNAPSQIGSAA